MAKLSQKEKDRLRRRFRKHTNEILNAIWRLTVDLSFQELADMSGLHISTIDRLYYGAYQYPRFETIQKLAHAVGYNVIITDEKWSTTLNKNFKSWKKSGK